MKAKTLDKKQRALVKLLRQVDERGEAKLDLVFKSDVLTGLSTVLRQEAQASRENTNIPAIVRVDTHKIGAYLAMNAQAIAHGVTGGNYPDVIRKLTQHLCADGARAICFVFDHAGAIKGEVMEKIFRSADDVAYNLDVSMHVIFIVTKVQKWEPYKQDFFPHWPSLPDLIKPRWRTFEYGAKGLNYLGDRKKFEALENEAPLLDSEAEPSRVLKLA